MDIQKLKAYLESQQWIRSLFETSNDSILLIEQDTGLIIDANPSACGLYGYSKHKLVGMHISNLSADCEKTLYSQQNRSKDDPARCHRKSDGTLFPVEISIGYFQYEDHIIQTVFIRDVTNHIQTEGALRISEAQLSNAMKLARLGHWEYDVTKGLFTFNDNFYAIFNTTAEQVGGYTMSAEEYANKFVHPDDAIQVGIETQKAIETSDPNFSRYVEHRFFYSDRTIGYLAVRIFILKDERGRTVKTYGVNQDITERILAEQTLKDSEERYHTLFENSLEAILLTDYNGDVYDANPAACKMFGFSIDQLREKGRDGLIDRRDMRLMEAMLKEVRDTVYSGELNFVNSNGNIFSGEVFSTVFKNKEGKLLISMFIRDITKRKEAEEALLVERTLLRNIVDNLPIALYLKDDKARKILCNPMDLKYIGRPASQVIGKNDFEILPKEVAEKTIADDFEVINSGKSVINREEHIINCLGKSIWLNTIKIPNRNQFGEVTGIIGMGIDISERKKAEEELIRAKERAEVSDQLKTAFLCNMSHEIRTPMNAILGFSEYLVKPGVSEEKKALFLKVIKDRAHDLLAIIEDILDISQLEIGQLQLVNSKVYVHPFIHDIYDYFQLRREIIRPDSTINFKLTIDEQINDLVINIDETRLKQVIANLLENAFKFTEQGTIDLSCKQLNDHELLFTVADTGIGIHPSKQTIIFDRFRQVDELPETRRFGGTGLGLSIAKGLIKLMGGEIWLESAENVGSKFYFTIPFEQIEQFENDGYAMDFPEMPDWQGKTFLIVEDEKTNAELLKEMIIPTSANIIAVTKGNDAINAIKTNLKIDLVLLDLRLPDGNGLDLLPIMKSIRPNVPVVAQTAFASNSDHQRCMAAGCDGYISKPIIYEDLLEVIKKVIY